MQEQVEQTNFLDYIDTSIRDRYTRRTIELSPKIDKINLINEPVVRYTETGQPMYQSDDPGEIYKRRDESLLDETPFRDQKIIGKTMYVTNGLGGKGYRAGFLDNEIVVKRLFDEQRKWPQKRNMRPYILLTPAKYHFTGKDQIVDREFKPGETVWITCGSELRLKGDRKKEKIEQIIRGY